MKNASLHSCEGLPSGLLHPDCLSYQTFQIPEPQQQPDEAVAVTEILRLSMKAAFHNSNIDVGSYLNVLQVVFRINIEIMMNILCDKKVNFIFQQKLYGLVAADEKELELVKRKKVRVHSDI